MNDFQKQWLEADDRTCALVELLERNTPGWFRKPSYIMFMAKRWPRHLWEFAIDDTVSSMRDYKANVCTGAFADVNQMDSIALNCEDDERWFFSQGGRVLAEGQGSRIPSFSIHWTGAVGLGNIANG